MDGVMRSVLRSSAIWCGLTAGGFLMWSLGCRAAPVHHAVLSPATAITQGLQDQPALEATAVQPVSPSDESAPAESAMVRLAAEQSFPALAVAESLAQLEASALAANPTLRRMQQEAAAAWDKVRYADKLPDPTLGGTFFVPPMNYEPDRQVADLQLMQMIPWLGRLKAEAQRAYFEALAAESLYHAEKLRIIGDLRAAWYRYYVLHKQMETALAEQAQLTSLIETANARVATGAALPGDVLMAALELSSLQEQLIGYRQQVAATIAELNRLAGRDAGQPIAPPAHIDSTFPEWNLEHLKFAALESQPEVAVARLRAAAALWGVEVARLQRRPDLTFGIGWVFMDAPGATSADAGRDSLTLGVSTTLPLSRGKYEAILSEATRANLAAHASLDEVVLRLDAQLRELWTQAQASHETVELYRTTILPQAQQTLEADLQSLANNTVTFDRVVRNHRALLNLQLSYHRALGQQAITLARIRQTVGADLEPQSLAPPPSAAP
jgi:cobalt-zinc-cadmium efflux system outer membrane protein